MINIRNVVTPIYGTTACLYRFLPWFWREALLAARWSEVANDGGAAWNTSNYLATYSDLYVDPANPAIVRTVGGDVSAHAGRILTLTDPTNDANCIIANIRAVINATTLYLNEQCLAKPWVMASGLTGKIHIGGQTSLLTAGTSWTVMQAPGGGTPLQVRIAVSATANTVTIDCLPKGDYVGAKTYTAAFSQAHTADNRAFRMNADISGETFLIWGCDLTAAGVISDYWVGIAGGSLLNPATGDAYPRFLAEIFSSTGFYSHVSRGLGYAIKMLSHTNTQVNGYVVTPKMWSGSTNGDVSCLFTDPIKTYSSGKIPVCYPWVWIDDVALGGYPRGQFPFLHVNNTWADWRRLDGVSPAVTTIRSSPGITLLPHGGASGCDIYPPLTAI